MPESVGAWAAARACYGAALCAAPAVLLRLASGPGSEGSGTAGAPDSAGFPGSAGISGSAGFPGSAGPAGRRACDVVRVLGARHLAQAAICARWPTRRVIAGSAVTDITHAASMIGLAVVDQRRRRVAIIDALVASTFAAAGIAAAWRSTAPGA